MTYIPAWAGFLYLAVVVDVFSRKVAGWSSGENMTANLVISALNMALVTRKPENVIHHSDQGSQYTSVESGKRCREMGVCPSMGSAGDACDNAMAESFFASLECELINRRSWKNKTEARLAVFTWIKSWHNPTRRHSGLGYLSPNNFERKLKENNQISDKLQSAFTGRDSLDSMKKMSVKLGQLQLQLQLQLQYATSARSCSFSLRKACV